MTCMRQVPSNEDPTLADKEAILASLNIKAMTFDDTIGVLSQGEEIFFLSSLIVFPFRLHGPESPFPPGLSHSPPQKRLCLWVERANDHRAGERQQRAVLGPGRRRRPGHRALPHPAVRLWYCLCRQRLGCNHVCDLLQPKRLDADPKLDHRWCHTRTGADPGRRSRTSRRLLDPRDPCKQGQMQVLHVPFCWLL